MASLHHIVAHLDEELNTSSVPDYPNALNGLQLENDGQIKHVVSAVDASLKTIETAAEYESALLLVHHGLFWQGLSRITDSYYRKIRIAMDANLAVYSSHLPLDIHPVLGNNILLAREIGLTNLQPFFDYKGIKLGYTGDWELGDLADLVSKTKLAVSGDAHLCMGNADHVGKVGILTGGAGGEIAEMAKYGVQTLITGEGPHWSFTLAQDMGLNLIYAGHYATETFGVRKLGERIVAKYQLAHYFLDFPTGL